MSKKKDVIFTSPVGESMKGNTRMGKDMVKEN